jgi:putative DNA primase/helicase
MALVRHLGGHWTGGRGMCRCPAHPDRSPSLSVRTGDSDLLFKCFAGCDTIDVLRAISRLGPIPPGGAATGILLPPAADEGWLRSRATDLWDEARAITDTPVERYLLNRAIGHVSPTLRFHPRTPLGPRRQIVFRPAMLAAVQEGARVIAVQRTFLDTVLARRARDLGNPRRMLGRPSRGAVMLADATDVLGLAEGVETALSAMILLGIPVWAALGNERLGQVAIPSRVDHLILLPDNDRPGRRAEVVAQEAHTVPGRTIETIWPWHGLNDWNDVLRRKGERGGGRTRQAA